MREVAFPQKINRRLTLVFGVLVFLIVIVGGISLYVAHSVLVTAMEVKKESDQIDLVDRLHYSSHHIIEALTMAAIGLRRLTENHRDADFADIRNVLQQYEAGSDVHRDKTVAMWRLLRRIEDASKDMVMPLDPSTGGPPNRQALQILAESTEEIQGIAHSLSIIHRGKMELMVRDSTWKMGVALGLYGGFIIVGILIVVGSSVFVTRAIARPLRSLADGAEEVASGNLDLHVPVTSKDEIGQLSHAFNVMVQRIRENEDQLQGLVMLEERERIAQEFHDTLAQDLVLLQMKLNLLEMDLSGKDSGAVLQELKNIRAIANDAYEDVRQAIFGLHTMVSKGLGLIPTLTEYLHDFGEKRKMAVGLKVHRPELIRLSPRAEIQLFHIIHEALSNVFKHSKTNAATLTFDCDSEFVRVMIEDKGKGFDQHGARNNFHIGLQSMKDRAEAVGGKLTLESATGTGTRVNLVLPLSGDGDEADTSAAS